MPRPRRHVGSGRLAVIPERWNADHAGVIAGTFRSSVTVRPAGGGTPTWDEESGTTQTTPPAAVYEGPAKITAVTSPPGGPADAVDEQVPLRIYEVLLELDVDAAVPGLVVHVDSSPDPMLDGKNLRVDHVDRGDQRFSRVLLATLNN